MDISNVNTDFLSRKLLSQIKQETPVKTSGVHNEKDNIEDKRLKKACADFEAILLNYMFQSMRKTLPGNDVFGSSIGMDMYESMYFQQLSTDIARGRNSLGIGDALYRQLKK